MAERIRLFDWASTPLGAMDTWPASLSTVVDLMLTTPTLATLAVGPERIFLYNDHAAGYFGSHHPGALGRSLPAIFSHEFGKVAPYYDRAFEGESLHVPAQELDPSANGTNEVFDAYLAPIRDHGHVIAVYMTGFAIGDRLRAEVALRDSEERLRLFGEATSDVLWTRDVETLAWDYLTPAFETIYGLSRQDALTGNNYRNWIDLIVPEDRDHASAAIERVRQGERVTFEYRIRRPVDGTLRWLRDTDFPIYDGTGRIIRIGGIGQDFTEQKRIEMEIRDRRRQLRMLVETIPQLVWRAVDQGDWIWASPQWTAFTGQAELDSHGDGWLEPVHPDDRDTARQAWADAGRTAHFEVEYRLRARDGSYHWFQTRATPIQRDGDSQVTWFGTSTDIDDLRQAQNHERLLRAELQHRVRNTLGVLRSLVRRTARTARTVDDYASHLEGRIEAFARVQSGMTRDPTRGIDLEFLIAEELRAVGARDGDTFKIKGPAVALSARSAESLGLAVHELATNAMKYGALTTPRGEIDVHWSQAQRDGQPMLDLVWRESGLRNLPKHPHRAGFGTELLTRTLRYELEADVTLDFEPGGLECSIRLPLDQLRLQDSVVRLS